MVCIWYLYEHNALTFDMKLISVCFVVIIMSANIHTFISFEFYWELEVLFWLPTKYFWEFIKLRSEKWNFVYKFKNKFLKIQKTFFKILVNILRNKLKNLVFDILNYRKIQKNFLKIVFSIIPHNSSMVNIWYLILRYYALM